MICRHAPASVPFPALRSSIFPALPRLALFSLLFGIFLSVSAMAQSANLVVGSASGLPGATVSIPVGFTQGATAVSTIQFDLAFCSSISHGAIATGPAAAAASKNASSNPISGGVRVVVFGLNQNAIGSGVIANIQLNIPAGTHVDAFPVAVGGIVASDADALPVSIAGIAGSIWVISPVSDNTAPTISGVSSSSISSTSATISWTTDEASDSQVEYGTTIDYGSSTSLNGAMATSHSQTLTWIPCLPRSRSRRWKKMETLQQGKGSPIL